ncbi:MAG: FimB/Mfa2 family fimbrial subunit [Alistipes senegalensis]|nr:FimB/Mfa2 family fimbrial subunit [Bacteroides cellulosilyticus]MCM1351316.1 FimB/Mfa2 family fimbrial subunit [Alistipes senegalensis]
MKNFLYLCTALVCAAAMPSCNEAKPSADVAPESERPGIRLFFENAAAGAKSRAFGTGTTEAWEKAVNTATVLVFDASGEIKFRRDLSAEEIAEAPTTPVSLVVPDVQEGEACEIAVVANRTVPANVVSMNLLLSEMDEAVADYNGTFDETTAKSLRPEGFVMTGRTQCVVGKGTTNVGVTLRRTVAKVEVTMSTTEAFRAKYGDQSITVDRIVLSRAAEASYLLDRSATDYADRGQEFTATQATSDGRNLFYVFEKASDAEGSRVLLTIEATYDVDGEATTTGDRIPIVYEVELQGAGEGKILRNGAYHVEAAIDGLMGNDVALDLTVADWETLETQKVNLGR